MKGPATSEETLMIKEYLLMTIALDIIERNTRSLNTLFKTPDPFIEFHRRMQELVMIEQRSIRNAFKRKGIKIVDEKRTSLNYMASYVCRGYHGNISLLWSFVKSEVEIRLHRYLGNDVSEYINPSIPEDIGHKFLLSTPPYTWE